MEGIEYASDPYGAAAGCDALLILTEWDEFAALDLHRIRALLKHPIVIDGRNLYQPDQVRSAGLIYYSIGRAVGIPEHMAPIAHHLEPGVQPLVTALASSAAAT
jgi:hypothetical protein